MGRWGDREIGRQGDGETGAFPKSLITQSLIPNYPIPNPQYKVHMTIQFLHQNLSRTATLFIAVLAVWALFSRIRSKPLDSNWFGAAVIGELILITQFVLGWLLYFQTGGVMLPRAYLHILYGVVAILALPAGYAYFSQLEDENVKSLALAFICFFLWGIIMRASVVSGGVG